MTLTEPPSEFLSVEKGPPPPTGWKCACTSLIFFLKRPSSTHRKKKTIPHDKKACISHCQTHPEIISYFLFHKGPLPPAGKMQENVGSHQGKQEMLNHPEETRGWLHVIFKKVSEVKDPSPPTWNARECLHINYFSVKQNAIHYPHVKECLHLTEQKMFSKKASTICTKKYITKKPAHHTGPPGKILLLLKKASTTHR